MSVRDIVEFSSAIIQESVDLGRAYDDRPYLDIPKEYSEEYKNIVKTYKESIYDLYVKMVKTEV